MVPLSIKARDSHPSAHLLFKGLVQRMILASFFPKYEQSILTEIFGINMASVYTAKLQ